MIAVAIILAISELISAFFLKLKIHKAEKANFVHYVPMHTLREITRLATMLAGLIAPRLRSPASIVARHAITVIVRLGT